jgi:hypothetical protein
MNAPESNQAFDLACACKLGRILGGHDPVTAVRRFPRVDRGPAETMEQHRFDLVKRTLAQTGGNVWATSRILDVNKTTIYDVLKRGGRKVVLKSKKIIRLAACLVALALTSCATPFPAVPSQNSQTQKAIAAMPALPRTLATAQSSVAPVKTNGVVTLVWSNGEPAETVVVNRTTGAVYPATTLETLTVGGLAVGSQQTFVATNASGASLPASVVVTPDTMRLTYQTWLYLTWPGPAGTLQRTTNLVIWQDVAPINANGGFIVTNNQAREFYRVKL